MTRTKTLAIVPLLALVSLAPVAAAQVKGIEITPTVGYRFDSSVSTDSSAIVSSVDVPGSVSFGLTAEFPVHPSLNVEVLWSHQSSDLEVDYRGTPPAGANTNLASLNVDTIQVGGLWQSGRSGDKVRGYFDFLLGASILSPSGNYDTLTRFSMTMGGGAKFRISDKVGVRLGVRWMPVYINSEDSGYYYCDPYWGCYEYYNTNYLSQVDTHVGLIIRF